MAVEVLKTLSNEDRSKMLYKFFESISATITKNPGGIFSAMVECLPSDMEKVSQRVAIDASIYMDKYIEEELNEDPQYYNRTTILFESQPGEKVIFFRWFA